MGFNSGFKGLNLSSFIHIFYLLVTDLLLLKQIPTFLKHTKHVAKLKR